MSVKPGRCVSRISAAADVTSSLGRINRILNFELGCKSNYHVMRKQTAGEDEGKMPVTHAVFHGSALPGCSGPWLYSVTLTLGKRICWQREDIAHWDCRAFLRLVALGHEDKCVSLCVCMHVCVCVRACRSRGLPVEWSMWMPTHSAASRPSSFRINPQPLNINRTGILKLHNTKGGNGIMHRPRAPQPEMGPSQPGIMVIPFSLNRALFWQLVHNYCTTLYSNRRQVSTNRHRLNCYSGNQRKQLLI